MMNNTETTLRSLNLPKPQSAPTIIPQYQEGGEGVVGCIFSCLNGLEYAIYLVLCCGCGISYDEYHEDEF